VGLREAVTIPSLSTSWERIDVCKYQDEGGAVRVLADQNPFSASEAEEILGQARQLVRRTRDRAGRPALIESFLQEYSLSTAEGLALMCLAEALLRTPDALSKNALIFEKISAADWAAHLGRSDSRLVNASTRALLFASKLEGRESSDSLRTLRRLGQRLGEPVVRAAAAQAVRLMSNQFVLGTDIESALARARAENQICSFDMLGEGARTGEDAVRYEAAYAASIRALQTGNANQPELSHGVSVKLSALSPRYEANQHERLWEELYPRLLRLSRLAAEANINLTIDAEESDRLIPSLKILDRLTREPELAGWEGLGLAVQAYQKRAPHVIAELARLARTTKRRLMVRLVKGAYWDSEVKRAQIGGMPDYPVFTTKSATDASYLVCAELIIQASPALYGQFATHNAHTLTAVRHMLARADVPAEFQRLHGMGEPLYDAAASGFDGLRVRTYAPVGAYHDLLPYLVRRLLENGANTSFVHLLLDSDVPVEQVVQDPFQQLADSPGRNEAIPVPSRLYSDRRNSTGANPADADMRDQAGAALEALKKKTLDGRPIIGGIPSDGTDGTEVRSLCDPAYVLGHTAEVTKQQIDDAFRAAARAQPAWDGAGGKARAITLRSMAESLQQRMMDLAALCVLEAGKTWPDAIAEVREAIDFCRYYALLAEKECDGQALLEGPAGEANSIELHGRGVFACISPWNFPLAIFTGQVCAALAAGNAVVAKPAEQTPLIAAEAVRLFHRAGLAPDLLHLVPGRGETTGAAIVGHARLAGVAFTGGTDTARTINRTLALRDGPIVPFIAETGGLNAMFVDTTAQREQVIDDVLLSAFGSAGQRCSALRILFLPEETADQLIEDIAGAMATLIVGDSQDFSTDIGPVIDGEAKDGLERHFASLQAAGNPVRRFDVRGASPLLFAPVLTEIKLDDLPDREVFGPILHVVRYRRNELEAVAAALARKGYGLTLGIHSRLDTFAERVRRLVPAGNTYINRSMIGAVVGVQPFGGEGLSGTGPKAGGPFAIYRYAVERAVSNNIAARGGDPALLNL
jgi:RHH-type proline utilization regulon transcriptional repressor/proline dehydrogenase/delta 1-pyrroline-5-carboxylate dehydrogenase